MTVETPTTAPPSRALLEQAVERLIAVIDQLDPDPDLEDNADDELSLGWANEGSQRCLRASLADFEGEHDGREPDYQRPPKGYMRLGDLRDFTFPSAGLKEILP